MGLARAPVGGRGGRGAQGEDGLEARATGRGDLRRTPSVTLRVTPPPPGRGRIKGGGEN